MRIRFSIYLAAFATPVFATDPPAADSEFRTHYISEYAQACVEGIEKKPDLRAVYSHTTVKAYCTCRERYSADVIAQAIKQDRRGAVVQDEAAEYASRKCSYILIHQLGHE